MGRKRSRDRSRGGSRGIISRRKLIGVLAAGGAGAAALEGTGAFSTIDSQRDLSVVSTDDDKAFISVAGGEASGADGDTVTLLRLTNQFNQSLTSISVTVVNSGAPIDPQTVHTPSELSPGGSGEVRARLNCGSDGTVKMRIIASSANQRVEFTRTAQVTCETVNVCAPRELPAGCAINKIPRQSTDCSVVIDRSSQITEQIRGSTTIGGAAEFQSTSQIKLSLKGNPVIREYLKIDTPAQVKLDVGGNSRVQGVVKVRTDSQLESTVSSRIDGGICVENAGGISLSPRSATINGDMSLTSTGQVVVETLTDATTGAITIDASNQVKLNETQNASINGPLTVTAAGQVTLGELVDVSTGPITIDGDGQVNMTTGSDTTVSGSVEVTDAGGQVELEFVATEITGGVAVANSSQIKLAVEDGSVVNSAIDLKTQSGVTVEVANSSVEDRIDINTNSQVDLDLSNASVDGDVRIKTNAQVELSLAGTQLDGSVTIESDSQVDVELADSSVSGDLTISTPSESSVEGCSSVAGEVTPQRACE